MWNGGGPLPYYALFGLPRKLRTLEKTLESIPKVVCRIPGWATFVMPGSCSPKSPGHRKRSDLSYPSGSRSTGRMGPYDPTELADWFHQQAPDIAYRFDQRNGYPAHQKKIETAWAGTQEMANQSN